MRDGIVDRAANEYLQAFGEERQAALLGKAARAMHEAWDYQSLATLIGELRVGTLAGYGSHGRHGSPDAIWRGLRLAHAEHVQLFIFEPGHLIQ
jgi:hypothetical protein